MDPFSAEGELVNIHNAFHTGQYAAVAASDVSSLSASNALPAKVLQLRARLALGQTDEVIAEASADSSGAVDLLAVKLFAQITKDKADEGAVAKMLDLAKAEGDNLTVQLLGATVMARRGMEREALTLLGRHQGSLDAVALIVQIHLSQNRLDLAQQEVRKARGWAQDSLLVNIAESWVGLREGGEKYQAAFYVYEELATAPPTSDAADNTQALLSQAICELHLGRLPEAEAAMTAALAQAPQNPDVLANAAVLNTLLGRAKEAAELKAKLAAVEPEHGLVTDAARRQEQFEAAKGKYKPVLEGDAETTRKAAGGECACYRVASASQPSYRCLHEI